MKRGIALFVLGITLLVVVGCGVLWGLIVSDPDGAIPCSEAEWEQRRPFDARLWQSTRDREKFVALLKVELIGNSSDDVRRMLGVPEHRIYNSTRKGYGYQLGTANHVMCDGALSQWLVVFFDDNLKSIDVKIFREVF